VTGGPTGPVEADRWAATEVGVGAALWAWQVTRPVRTAAGSAAGAMAGAVLALTPPDVRSALTERARSGRAAAEELASALLRFAVRGVVAAVVDAVDLTELVRRHVDLDAVAAGIDLDAAVARVDLDAIVRRVDLDAAVARVDLDAIVRRIDLDGIAARLDLDALAARIDPDRVVARVDLDAVLARVDVLGIAREVVDGIDLPEIIRHSTGTLTSDTVRTVRREAMQADEVVAGIFDRLLRRHLPRAPAPPAPLPS
jgi:hypothetical protein